jgi:hypothetical protein
VAVHREVVEACRGVIARLRPDRGQRVEVHAAREGGFAGGQDDALDRVVGERLVDQRLDGCKCLPAQDVHGLVRHVPGDDGNAIGVDFHREIGHVLVLF